MVILFVPKWLCCLNEAEWPIYVLPECWFISVLANFRFSICPLFSKGHAEIFREFRHDLCYKLGHIECPGFAAPGRSQRSCKTIGLFYVIIHFIRSRINWQDLIIGNMASNDEGQGSVSFCCSTIYVAYHRLMWRCRCIDHRWRRSATPGVYIRQVAGVSGPSGFRATGSS